MNRLDLQAIIDSPQTSDVSRAALLRQLQHHATEVPAASLAAPSAKPVGMAALASVRRPGHMTKTERLYAIRLDAMRHAGQVRAWKYEAINLKLDTPDAGRAITYRPDFLVWHGDGSLTFDEVKGGWMAEKGVLKFRFAVEQYPELHLRMWQWKDGCWTMLRESK